MKCAFWKQCGESLVLAGVVLGMGAWARAQEPEPPKAAKVIEVELQLDGGAPAVRFTKLKEEEAGKELTVRAVAVPAAGSEYWIGVQLASLDEFALAQLKLKQGISAAEVFPDSPAQKGGVQKHDVLLKFGETDINTPEDLVAAVEKTKEQEAELAVLRGGEKLALKVKPVKRSNEGRFKVEVAPPADEVRRVESWLRRLGKGEPGADPVDVFRFRPGVILPETKRIEFPKDLSVSVEKQGNEPAKIKVKQGEKQWETTADKLGDLPAEVRPYVENLLGPTGTAAHRIFLEPRLQELPLGGPKGTFTVPVPIAPHVLPKVEVRGFSPDNQNLDAVRKELHELMKRVEAMRNAPKAETPIEQMKRELAELRKELDELRKNSGDSEKK